MPVSAADMNEIRVGVLGQSVDQPGAAWTAAPPAAANTLNTADRVPTRALNTLNSGLTNALNGTNTFAGRFDAVVGNEQVGDQSAFATIGSNLIQAVSTLVAAGPGGGGPPITFAATPPTPQPGRLYSNTINGHVYMAGPTGGWFRVF